MKTDLIIKQKEKKADVYLNDNMRVFRIGVLKKGKFFKQVEKSKHLFKVLDAWGLDAQLVNEILAPKNYDIVIFDKEEDKVYEINAKEFQKQAQYYHFKEEEQDHRTQLFLPRNKWGCSSVEDYKLKMLKL